MGDMLDKLQAEQPNLLMGEVAALLHDLSKLSDEFVIDHRQINTFQVFSPDDPAIQITSKRQKELLKNTKKRIAADLVPSQVAALRHPTLFLQGETYSLVELITLWHSVGENEFSNIQSKGDWLNGRSGYIIWLLNACHGLAHVDKQDSPDSPSKHVYCSTPFGKEFAEISIHGQNSLTQQLKSLDFSSLLISTTIHNFVAVLQNSYLQAVADNRRPFNEVTLWDWGWSVAALYKSALAQLIIEQQAIGQREKTHQRWRTLRVTVDVLGLLARAQRIPDVLGYERVIQAGFDRVKEVIEVIYALGNEIYRDSTGIYFTFPGVCAHLSAKIMDELRLKIHDAMIGGQNEELAPEIAFGASWGEHTDDQWAYAPRMLAHPIRASKSSITSGKVATYFKSDSMSENSGQQEVCPICGIRLFSKKAESKYRVVAL